MKTCLTREVCMRRFGKVVVVAYVLLFAQCSRASFSTIFQSATVDEASKTVQFDMLFNEAPDFSSTNAQGDDASAFQVFIDPRPTPSGFDYFDTVSLVRGVHLEGMNELPVLDVKDGAFGDVRGVATFDVQDAMVHFAVPFEVLGTRDGRFDYRVESYEYGTLTSMIDSTTVVVPLPPAVLEAIPAALLAAVAMMMWRRSA